jgi:hypothetical protein
MYGDLQGLIGSSLQEIPALTASSPLEIEPPIAAPRPLLAADTLDSDDDDW